MTRHRPSKINEQVPINRKFNEISVRALRSISLWLVRDCRIDFVKSKVEAAPSRFATLKRFEKKRRDAASTLCCCRRDCAHKPEAYATTEIFTLIPESHPRPTGETACRRPCDIEFRADRSPATRIPSRGYLPETRDANGERRQFCLTHPPRFPL
jgi:hypothetical protein